jgi:amidohydrolase
LLCPPAADIVIAMNISPDVRANIKELVALRRVIHQYPEPGFKEFRTSSLIRGKLKSWGVDHKAMCGTGVVGLIKGSKPGPTMLIRADMDALPLTEKNQVPYCSRNKGHMHACGHDGHVAMALMAAKLLAKRRTSFRGNVKFMFQPAEEGPGGAGPMMDEGLLKGPKVDAAFAIHMWNDLPTGRMGVRSGPVFASADEFTIKVIGRGGHGAAPHQTIDPVAAAAQIVTACQTIVSRKVDPTKSAVVTFGQIHGGTRHNIIPDVVEMTGTVRAFEEPIRKLLQREIPKVAGGVAAALGARMEFDYHRGYPPTINEESMTDLVRDSVREAAGTAAAVEQDVSMGAEDMSLVLQEVPGCYFFLGSMNPRKGLVHPHHSSQFNFDEDALALGVETWLRLATRFLNVA